MGEVSGSPACVFCGNTLNIKYEKNPEKYRLDKYDDEWFIIYDQMQKQVQRATKKNKHKDSIVIYSAYKCTADGLPINNLNKVAVKGKVQFVRRKDSFWGLLGSKDYKSVVFENPTWLQVAVAANSMIMRVKDEHHVFLEGVRYLRTDLNGVKIYSFAMGS